MRRAALLLCLLAACKAPETRIVTVQVPVAVPCPEPPLLLWPDLPLSHITASTPDGEVAKAYVASIQILKGRLAETLALLNGYRTSTPKTTLPGAAHE